MSEISTHRSLPDGWMAYDVETRNNPITRYVGETETEEITITLEDRVQSDLDPCWEVTVSKKGPTDMFPKRREKQLHNHIEDATDMIWRIMEE